MMALMTKTLINENGYTRNETNSISEDDFLRENMEWVHGHNGAPLVIKILARQNKRVAD